MSVRCTATLPPTPLAAASGTPAASADVNLVEVVRGAVVVRVEVATLAVSVVTTVAGLEALRDSCNAVLVQARP
jgi:hypothetical protein